MVVELVFETDNLALDSGCFCKLAGLVDLVNLGSEGSDLFLLLG
jgi:hypothetical protein